MDRETAERRVREWIGGEAPAEEGVGGSGHHARLWSQLDELQSVEAEPLDEGEATRLIFVWSRHRESEFTVYTEEGDESLLFRQRTSLLISAAGEVIEEIHETLGEGLGIGDLIVPED
ncbi:MAG: hypothetical protein P1V51_18975 [Deltaproteobacteria bacterium]|nr:hypothetical protein [Deltaproteobacteria bacterium]